MRTDFSCELATAATHDNQHLFADTSKQAEGCLHRQVMENRSESCMLDFPFSTTLSLGSNAEMGDMYSLLSQGLAKY
jgi:hypothetical protein